tara:strand:+ start:3358 stop:3759 length:402 start_codon:yes stop_codon:yes gene_type:complete
LIALEIIGGTRKEKRLAEDAFWFALKHLMPRKRNLEVEIYIKNLPEHEGNQVMVDKGFHEIELRRGMAAENIITSLFHEMVHVRQSERGEYMDFSLPYLERPFEIEAYKLQESMFEKYKYSYSNQHSSWKHGI